MTSLGYTQLLDIKNTKISAKQPTSCFVQWIFKCIIIGHRRVENPEVQKVLGLLPEGGFYSLGFERRSGPLFLGLLYFYLQVF